MRIVRSSLMFHPASSCRIASGVGLSIDAIRENPAASSAQWLPSAVSSPLKGREAALLVSSPLTGSGASASPLASARRRLFSSRFRHTSEQNRFPRQGVNCLPHCGQFDLWSVIACRRVDRLAVERVADFAAARPQTTCALDVSFLAFNVRERPVFDYQQPPSRGTGSQGRAALLQCNDLHAGASPISSSGLTSLSCTYSSA